MGQLFTGDLGSADRTELRNGAGTEVMGIAAVAPDFGVQIVPSGLSPSVPLPA
jgi:hypothetical protein